MVQQQPPSRREAAVEPLLLNLYKVGLSFQSMLLKTQHIEKKLGLSEKNCWRLSHELVLMTKLCAIGFYG
jgi:hypothetical protein